MRTPRALLLATLMPALTLGARVPAHEDYPAFEVLPSTRRITALAPRGARVLAGTTGGLVDWDPASGDRRILLPGVPIRDLAPTPGDPERVVIASDTGTFVLAGDELAALDGDPAQALLVEAGRVYTGHPGGLVKLHRAGAVLELHVPTSSPVHSLLQVRGNLLVASVEGIWHQVRGRFVAERLPGGALARSVTRLEQRDGRVLAATPVGVFERRGFGRWKRVPTGDEVFVTDLADSTQGLLVGTAGDGLLRLGASGPERLDPDLAASWLAGDEPPPDLSHATALLELQGRLLVGTPDEGLFVRGPQPGARWQRAWDLAHEPPGTTITSLAHADVFGTLVVGTFEQGVGLLQAGDWRHFKQGQAHLLSSWVNHVASDGRRVLVRYSDGSVYTQIGRERFRQLGAGDGWPKNWTSAAGSSQGRQWVGTQNAFYLRDADGWSSYAPKPELQGELVLDVALHGDTAWLATHRGGLLRWDATRDLWDRFSLGQGLPDTWVTAVEVFGGEVWAGTFNGGLVHAPLDATTPEAWVPVRHGDAAERLPSDGVQCLLAAEGGLWIGTFEGLTWTDGKTWRTYGLEHGLPSVNILSLTTGGGALWVGTDAGLARADLKDLR